MNLSVNDLSYWERKMFFDSIDFLVVGAGIVGISCAFHLKEKHPNSKIIIIDKGTLPFSATSKNAGFACFGSPTEILSDLRTTNSLKVWETVDKRWKGLQALEKWVNKETIDLQINGSWDLIQNAQKTDEIKDNLSFLNEEIQNITGEKNVYSEDQESISGFGFQNLDSMFKNRLEGQIDTAKLNQELFRKASEKEITILRGIELQSFNSEIENVKLETNIGEFQCANLIICTNGFSNTILPDLNVEPARAQVIITKPIENLKIKGTFHFDEGYFYFRNCLVLK